MDITVAKTAGFCFGVARAVDSAYQCSENKDKKYCTLGPIIHNTQVVNDLKEKGIDVIHSLAERPEDATVIIRTHGVPEALYREMEEQGIEYLDLTCPFVKKIHNLVSKHYKEGYQIIIIALEDPAQS